MKKSKNYCIKCNKYRKFKNPKKSYIFNETVVLSIIYNECGNNNDRVFKKKKLLSCCIKNFRVNFQHK